MRDPCTTVAQVHPDLSETAVNTSPTVTANRGMVHKEGGWPKEVDSTVAEHVIRYRKKVERAETYNMVPGLGVSCETIIKQNNAVDIYEEYFSDLIVDHSSEVPSARTLTVLKDPHTKYHRSASYVSWYPVDIDGGRKIAVAYSILDFQKQPNDLPLSSYIWDITQPHAPDFEIKALSQLCCIQYSPKDPNILCGGHYNGQIAYWDTRKGHNAVEVSPVENSHKDPLWDVAWIRSKTGTECLSVSTDGYALFWDIRRLGEPIQKVLLKDKVNQNVHGAMSLSYNATAGPGKFMVGTETGAAIACNKTAKNPVDMVGALYPGHHAPVLGIDRNPFFTKYFLTVGDWTARVWTDELKTPVITTRYHKTPLNTGKWSPTRPGVFFTGKADGVLDIWDLFYKQSEPVLSITVSDDPLSALAIQQQGRLVACGAKDGDVSILELCDGLVEIQSNEKQSMNQLFERETKREKNLDQIEKEARMKAKKEARMKSQAANGQTNDEEGVEEILRSLEVDFFEQTRKTDEDNGEEGDLLSAIESGEAED